jgi:hypothetical protein
MHLAFVVYSGVLKEDQELVSFSLSVQETTLPHLRNSVVLFERDMMRGILRFGRSMALCCRIQLGEWACTDRNCHPERPRWVMIPESL